VFLLLVNALLLCVGCVLDTIAAITFLPELTLGLPRQAGLLR
jgi:TRAP-type C4-dicarboxylate transport system permease large subunit